MHILQSKHTKLNEKEVKELLAKFNIARTQLPKIKIDDPALPENCQVEDIVKIERKEDEQVFTYFRVVI